MKKSILLPLVISLSSCVQLPLRKVAGVSYGPFPPTLDNLSEASKQILLDVSAPEFPEYCGRYLKELESDIDSLDVKSLSPSTLSKDAEAISATSWQIRKTLHSKLPELPKECAIQLQSTFRQFRFVEDYLLEISRKVTHLGPKDINFQNEPRPIVERAPFYRFNEAGRPLFQSGDILITRGVSFLSGMIARLGQRSTQFSHVVMVYEDPEDKKMKTIESYVGVGVQFYDLDYALKNENARILWLRAKDKALGKKAASIMGDLVKQRLKEKDPIKYDYELNFNDASTMSCAEVSQVAFLMASNNQFRIPYYPNEIAGAKSFIERLKLVEGETYEPGDMEIDPRFELIGEFQDLRLTRDSRQKDAIMTALFDWMEHKGYVMKDNMKSKMAGGIIYDVRRTFMWPLVKKILKLDDFSTELPRNMLSTVTIINQLGEQILKELKAKDLAYEKKYGLPMTYMDFYKVLEDMRVEDLKLYENKKTRKQSKIHHLLRPS